MGGTHAQRSRVIDLEALEGNTEHASSAAAQDVASRDGVHCPVCGSLQPRESIEAHVNGHFVADSQTAAPLGGARRRSPPLRERKVLEKPPTKRARRTLLDYCSSTAHEVNVDCEVLD